jgi:glycosyltransferase involved in cell wall biosynthesis
MALGAPVAASRLPVLDEVLGDAAFYFDPRDPASLAGAVRAALDSPDLLVAASRKGRERAALFSWEKTAREVADAYREVAMRAG